MVTDILTNKLLFYSHVNYSVTKINLFNLFSNFKFYSHVNYSVTKIADDGTST